MKEVAVLTDLFCEIPQQLLKEVDDCIGGDVNFKNGSSYKEDVVPWLLLKNALLKDSPLPTTSAPTPGVFLDKYEGLLKKARSVFSIHISSELTGTVNGARFASSLKSLPVEVYDSRTMGMAEGFIALEAARVANLGGNIHDVKTAVEEIRVRTGFGILAYPQKPIIESKRFPGLEERVLNKTVFISMNDGYARLESASFDPNAVSKDLLNWLKNDVVGNQVQLALAADWRIGMEDKLKLLEQIKSEINISKVYISPGSPIYSIHLGKSVRVAYLLDKT